MDHSNTVRLAQAELLEQVGWLRRLARELVADRELAEDLVQDACVVALERSPRDKGRLRPWLAQVLRNALRQHARAQGRRKAREEATARREAEPADGLVERVLMQRELVDFVLELDEPYRSTVLLRFFDELPPREIARRTGTPLATVQSRLQRARARLRERLDGRDRAWAALFFPWTQGLEPLGSVPVLPLLMKTKLSWIAAATLAAGAFVWWQAEPEEGRERASAAATALAAPADPPDRGAPPPEPAVSEREPVRESPLAAPEPRLAPEAAPSAPWVVRLRVLDADALPMSGVAVRAEAGETVLGTSGAGGWCVFETRAERLVLSAADPRWVTVHQGSPARTSSVDPVLVLAPAIDLAGSVRDELGRPLPHASVHLELPDGFRTRFAEVLEATREQGWRVSAGSEGAFSLERVPAVAGSTLAAVLAGYERAEIEAPLSSSRGLELVLSRPRMPLAGVLRGRVIDALGTAVDGARVTLGLAAVTSDERGRFELALARAVTSEILTAVKAGHLPSRLERPDEPDERSSGWPDEVVLVLPGPALAIAGVVLDHDGKPVAGARVWVHDPTPATAVGMVPMFLEPMMAGAEIPPSALETEANLPRADGDDFFDWVTNVSAPSALWNWVVTDEAGRFELTGLDQRRYRLEVLRPGSLQIEKSDSLAAGERQAVIRLGPPDVYARVEGRVRAEDGTPLSGIGVWLHRPVIDARARIFGGNSQLVVIENAGRVTTDAEGAFHFEDVPKDGSVLAVRGDGIVPRRVDVDAPTLDIPVEVRCHFEVVVRELPERFDGIAVADAEGKGLDVMVLTEGSMNAYTSVPLVDGRSGVVSVSSRARLLKLLKDELVVETMALDLLPTEVNRIEL